MSVDSGAGVPRDSRGSAHWLDIVADSAAGDSNGIVGIFNRLYLGRNYSSAGVARLKNRSRHNSMRPR